MIMGETVDFLARAGPSIIGPEIRGNAVIVDGLCIPNMHCFDCGDEIEIIIDRRFSYTFPKEWAYLAAAMAAQAMAIGEGYTHLEVLTKDRCFAPRIRELKP